MVFRSWLAFCIVIGVLLLVLGVLSVLQHNAVLSELLRQRISVVAQTTASSFKPIVDLGLPISMIRNGDAIVARALATDPQVRAVHAFNPSGIIVYSTDPQPPEAVPREVLRSMQLSDDIKWSVETADQIYSGFNVVRRNGELTGSVVVAYPKDRLEAAANALITDLVREALAIWAGFSAISYVVLRLLMKSPQRRLATLEAAAKGEIEASEVATSGQALAGSFWRGLFGREIEQLGSDLVAARAHFMEAEHALAEFTSAGPALSPPPQEPARSSELSSSAIAANPSRSLARRVASRLTPIAAILILASALLLAVLVLGHVNRSIEPELAARTNLIATVVSEDVQRAVAAGVPLDGLVDAETYFSEMLKQMPEIAYVAIATGRVVLEAGKRIDPYLAPPRERKDVRSHPIMHDGEEIAYVVIDVDPAFIAKKFLDVFLDMSVIVVVAVLAAYEIMVLLSSRSLTASLDRLQRLAALQAAGDFSKRANVGVRSVIDRATRVLVERADALSKQFAAALAGVADNQKRRIPLEALRSRYGLATNGPMLLRFSYFTDLRLALFLFAAADEMPISFMPLYTRAAANPFPWIPESVLVSLPLAGYLLAIVLVAPFARPLSGRFGPRALLLIAAAPTIAAHLWLHFASGVTEIVAARIVLGTGYALVTLACQDYVIDNTPRDERDRSLGMFSSVLFGGIFCGTALGGVLADRLGQVNVFLLSAIFVFISAVLIFTLVGGKTGEKKLRAMRPPLLAALRNVRFAGLVFGIAIPIAITLQAFLSYLVALMLDGIGSSPADIGRTLMVALLAIALIGPVAGQLVERGMSPRVLVLTGATLSAVSLLVAVVWPTQVGVFLAVLGAGVGEGLLRGANVSIALSIAETELRHLGSDAVLGALRAGERFGSIVGLLFIATIASFFGYTVATAAVAAIALSGAALFAASLFAGGPFATRQPAR